MLLKNYFKCNYLKQTSQFVTSSNSFIFTNFKKCYKMISDAFSVTNYALHSLLSLPNSEKLDIERLQLNFCIEKTIA